MLETIIIIAVAIYITGLVVCGVAFMNDYTAQVDFLFWLLATLFWPVTWWYIWIRVHNDDRAQRLEKERRDCELGIRLCPKHFREKFGEATGIVIHPLEDGQCIVEGARWRDE